MGAAEVPIQLLSPVSDSDLILKIPPEVLRCSKESRELQCYTDAAPDVRMCASAQTGTRA